MPKAWYGYARIVISTPLTDDLLDEEGNVIEEGTKTLVRQALLSLGSHHGPPNLITAIRPSLDYQSFILELEWEHRLRLLEVLDVLVEYVGWTMGEAAAATQLFDTRGWDWEEQRQEVDDYLIADKDEWNDVL